MKIRSRKFALFAVVLGLGSLALLRCVSFGPPDNSKAFIGRTPPSFHSYQVLGREVFAAEIGPKDAPPVLYIHGSPGSWDDATDLMIDPQLVERVRLIAVDRPGFGKSGYGQLETSLARQAAMLAGVLAQAAPGRPAIVVGHSLGGPVAARLAMDDPGSVAGLVLVAGSIDPALEKTTWYQKAARWPVVRSIVPKILQLANDEIRPLKGELQKMMPLWSGIHMPVEVIQGDGDALVPPANADFAQRMLTGASVHMMRIPKQGHLIPWERPDLIRDAILRLLDGEK
ncbi:MAG TPA: alpha/beta hydrolase [Thermoanaerobaculia bacterium]|jgi:pimeloyl-ACP methyl ester carboxylesterase|nr:alpha/beta hydrolase [Thermoanaerobaculia bacterium]